jgi:hypothetical protein
MRGARLASWAFLGAAVATTLAIGCGSSTGAHAPPINTCDAYSAYEALFVASDYTSSGVGALSLDGPSPLMKTGADLGGDPALSVSIATHRAFYIARDQDAVFEIDRCSGAPIAKWNVGEPAHVGSANPQDVAVAGDGSLWVARYNVASLVVVAPGGSKRTLDLSRFDGDGNPNASAIRIVGAKAFVTLERVDDGDALRSKQPSSVVRIDTATDAIEAEIVLEGRNPFSVAEHDGAFWLAEPGNFDAGSEPLAGIERFDLASSTSRLVMHESDLGGSVTEVAIDGSCGAAIVADATSRNATSLVLFDPRSGLVMAPASRPLFATPEFSLQGLAWLTDAKGARVLAVGDRGPRGANGYVVHVFEDQDGGSGADAGLHCEPGALRQRPDAVFIGQKPVAIAARP